MVQLPSFTQNKQQPKITPFQRNIEESNTELVPPTLINNLNDSFHEPTTPISPAPWRSALSSPSSSANAPQDLNSL